MSDFTADFLKGIMSDVAMKQARIRELEVQAGRLEADIAEQLEERSSYRADTEKIKQECLKEQSKYLHLAAQAKGEYDGWKAQIDALKIALDKEKDDHRLEIAAMKGKYAQQARDLQDDIAKLVARRDGINKAIQDVVAKWSH